ncbi:hypothetical protein FK519_28320 [Klebsiella pneumoniae]|nr:hypothetical protein [Klebsiella pneumoniae]
MLIRVAQLEPINVYPVALCESACKGMVFKCDLHLGLITVGVFFVLWGWCFVFFFCFVFFVCWVFFFPVGFLVVFCGIFF